jgi:hypothetical protein
MDLFEQRLAADMAAIADTLPPLGPAARQARRTPPLAPLAATVAVLTIALGAAYVATTGDDGSPLPAGQPSTTFTPGGPVDPQAQRMVTERLQRQYQDLPGAAGFELGEDGVVRVSWDGPVPAEVAAEAGQHEGGVMVQIVRVSYSSDELAAAMDTLTASYSLADVPGFVAFGPDEAMAGLRVEVSPLPEPAEIARLEDELSAAAGVPVILDEVT